MHRLSVKGRQRIMLIIEQVLKEDPQVLFSYLIGSFQGGDKFRDIDVAVYLKPDTEDIFSYGLRLRGRINKFLPQYSVDLRILNDAPLSFQFEVITKGDVIHSKNRDKLLEFEVQTRREYFDFASHRRYLYQKIVLGR